MSRLRFLAVCPLILLALLTAGAPSRAQAEDSSKADEKESGTPAHVLENLDEQIREGEQRLKKEPGDVELRFKLARLHYMRGLESEPDSTNRAGTLLESLLADGHDAPVHGAYLGSIRLLQSGRTWKLWDKEKLAREGIKRMDEAVKAAPEDVEVRFVRAMTTFNLPGLFKREAQSIADFKWLAERVPDAVEAGEFDAALGAAAMFHHGVWRDRKRDRQAALEAWRVAQRLAPDAPAGKDAARRLKDAG